jgi:hypothetical protein
LKSSDLTSRATGRTQTRNRRVLIKAGGFQ